MRAGLPDFSCLQEENDAEQEILKCRTVLRWRRDLARRVAGAERQRNIKKRWPDLADEMEHIQKEVSERLDNDEEQKKDIRERIASNI